MRAVRQQRGTTLVELIVAIVVIGICVACVLGLLSSMSMRSAGQMARSQATSIAVSYLDEILSKNYTANGREASRALYDDVSDYDTLSDIGAYNASGAAIAGLNLYNVQVSVSAPANVGGVMAKRVEVTVTDPTGATLLLTGFRTNYAGQVLN